MLKTLSFTPAAAVVALPATPVAALVAISVYVEPEVFVSFDAVASVSFTVLGAVAAAAGASLEVSGSRLGSDIFEKV